MEPIVDRSESGEELTIRLSNRFTVVLMLLMLSVYPIACHKSSIVPLNKPKPNSFGSICLQYKKYYA